MKPGLLLLAGYKSVAHYLVLSNLAAPGEDAAANVAESPVVAFEPAVMEHVQAPATRAAGQHIAPNASAAMPVSLLNDDPYLHWTVTTTAIANSPAYSSTSDKSALCALAVAAEATAVVPPQEEGATAAASPAPTTGASPAATLRQTHIDMILVKAKGTSKAGSASKAKLAKPAGWAFTCFTQKLQMTDGVHLLVELCPAGAAAGRVCTGNNIIAGGKGLGGTGISCCSLHTSPPFGCGPAACLWQTDERVGTLRAGVLKGTGKKGRMEAQAVGLGRLTRTAARAMVAVHAPRMLRSRK